MKYHTIEAMEVKGLMQKENIVSQIFERQHLKSVLTGAESCDEILNSEISTLLEILKTKDYYLYTKLKNEIA